MNRQRRNKDENFRVVYGQYWLHARHQEDLRFRLINYYVLIVGGIFTFSDASKNTNDIYIFLFLTVFLF